MMMPLARAIAAARWYSAIDALRTYLRRKDAKPGNRVRDLMYFARINRVQAVMAPYIESML